MATTTARLGLRKPASGDTVNVVTDIDNAMDTLDSVVGMTDCTSTTRPSTPFKNQLIRETDTGSYYVSNGSSPASGSWVPMFSVEGPVTVGVTGSVAPWQIQTTSTIAGNRLLNTRKQGDAQSGYILDFDGRQQWGPGGATSPDTNLYRSGPAALKTDGSLIVAGVGGVLTAYKTTDLTVNNSTVLVSDAQLVVPVVANATYAFESCLIYSATTVAKAAMAVAGPAGASALISPRSIDVTVTAYYGPIEVSMAGLGGSFSSGAIGVGQKVTALATGTISTAGTAGNIVVQFCQNTAEASNAVLHTWSWIKLTRLA